MLNNPKILSKIRQFARNMDSQIESEGSAVEDGDAARGDVSAEIPEIELTLMFCRPEADVIFVNARSVVMATPWGLQDPAQLSTENPSIV